MAPVVVAGLVLSLLMVWFNDQVMPAANYALQTLSNDIARKKPTFALRPQIINQVSPSLYLRAMHLTSGTSEMRDVTIYDFTDPNHRRTIRADSGHVEMSSDGRDLIMTLAHGFTTEMNRPEPLRLQRVFFKTSRVRVRGIGNQLERNTSGGERSDRERTVCELRAQLRNAITTRDSIYVDFERGGRPYTLIDTAGMRRRGRVDDAIEKFSVVKTMQAIEDANVVVLVLDGSEKIVDQDAHIAGYVLDAGRALVIAVNKWDNLTVQQREWAKQTLERTLNFMDFAEVHHISALTGSGIPKLFGSIERAYQSAMAKLATPKLTRALMAAVARQAPPRSGMFRPKMRYAHQGGSNPPRVIIHGSGLERVPETYRRYLEHFFRDAFKLRGAPLKIEFRQGMNPYERRHAKR